MKVTLVVLLTAALGSDASNRTSNVSSNVSSKTASIATGNATNTTNKAANSSERNSTSSSHTAKAISGSSDNGSNSSVHGRESIDLGSMYLAPTGQVTCPAKCRNYFGGAVASDDLVCQKQASGVGTTQENAELGVNCFPPYGCGKDMITCVNPNFTGALPNRSDEAACASLSKLNATDPRKCGQAGDPGCGTVNSPQGRWAKRTADIDCGYEAGITRVRFEQTDVWGDYECCLKAMVFETSPWSEGGAAIMFQARDTTCFVQREASQYENVGGVSMKYQGMCGDGGLYYRQATGQADAANLDSGGRCVVENGFSRVTRDDGFHMPQGEVGYEREFPEHPCEFAAGGTEQEQCLTQSSHVILYNTINNAEDCCNECSTLNFMSAKGLDLCNGRDCGGNASRDAAGFFENPCLAWQIVFGRCHIVRKAFLDSVDGLNVFDRVSARFLGNVGCGQDAELCNYYSSIFYREAQTTISNASANASFRKLSTIHKSILNLGNETASTLHVNLSIKSFESRRDRRIQLISHNDSSDALPGNETAANCGRLEVYVASEALMTGTSGFQVFNESAMPVATSECTSSSLTFSMDLANLTSALSSRRLSSGIPTLALSFSGVGSGYDTMDFLATAKVLPSKSSGSPANSTSENASSAPTPNTSKSNATAKSNATHTAKSNATEHSVDNIGTASGHEVVSGFVLMTVADPAAFIQDTSARAVLAEGIAALVKVNASQVDANLSILARRLSSQGQVKAAYSIQVPAGSATALAEQLQSTSAADLTGAILAAATSSVSSSLFAGLQVSSISAAAYASDGSLVPASNQTSASTTKVDKSTSRAVQGSPALLALVGLWLGLLGAEAFSL